MADFDSFNYDIESKLPEWWKGFGALEPINQYTQELLAKILQNLLTIMGVVQPLNCWLTVPEEYTWYRHYMPTDTYLIDENGNQLVTSRAVNTLFPGNKIFAQVPSTKYPCNAKIKLKLLGSEVQSTSLSVDNVIKELTIQNENQLITIKNINPTSTIEILTESNEILIDGEVRDDLVTGTINKIKPVIKYPDYKDPHTGENINIMDENKKTEIVLHSSNKVNFDLQIYLFKPTYTTEQNIRIATVSAFPLEWVKIYGYFCHPFNNKAGYQLLYKKEYTEESRTVYDRITTQFDCDRFYIKVKFQGIGVPLMKGFPQELGATMACYQLNPQLDKWGRLYNLPRRVYKPDISEDELPFTFPKYYPYEIEQDYWYEERLINEYRYDDDAINTLFVKDSDYNNIGYLECIYPFMNDIWVYTETIDPKENLKNELDLNQKNYIDKDTCSFSQNLEKEGVEWDNPNRLPNTPIHITLNPKSSDIIDLNDNSYKTKPLKCSFNLKPFDEETPKNITIKGLELRLETDATLQSNTVKLDSTSKMILPYFSPNLSEPVLEPINIVEDDGVWLQEKGWYVIGGENNLFQRKEITREQLFKGNDGKIDFELVFINDNKFLESILYIKNISLKIYYELIPSDYDIQVTFENQEINLRENTPQEIKLNIYVENKSNIEINNKEIFIITPPELQIENDFNSFKFHLDVNEHFTIDDITIKPTIYPDGIRTGLYDVLIFCEDKVFTKEILIRGKGT